MIWYKDTDGKYQRFNRDLLNKFDDGYLGLSLYYTPSAEEAVGYYLHKTKMDYQTFQKYFWYEQTLDRYIFMEPK